MDRFSYFLPPVRNTLPDSSLSVEEVWEYISGRKTLEVLRIDLDTGQRTRIGTLQEVTQKVRSLSPEDYNNKQRGKVTYLPLCTFGGIFSQRKGDGLQETSGLIGLDIDHLSALGMDLEELKDRISKDREIGARLVFTSPSGDGLKIVCKTAGEITDRESYRREFEILQGFVSGKYGIPVGSVGLDKGISNIDRGCLLCYDPGAVLQTWEDSFKPDLHPLPQAETRRPKKERRETLSPWDWDSFREEKLIPALFERIDLVFPEMSFRWRGNTWESPYKLDGSPSKDPRTDKSVITSRVPGVILEQGGEAVPVIDYYMKKNSLSFAEAMRELSRLCGLEEDYSTLCRIYAKSNNPETYMERPTTGGQPSSISDPEPQLQTSQRYRPETQAEREERYRRDYLTIPDPRSMVSQKKEGVKTGYRFMDSRGKEEYLTLPSGSLTLICGKSSHGKTRFLQNLSLQMVESPEEGAVLFFSFEEDYPEVLIQFANLHTNTPYLSQFGTDNAEVLRDYFKTGELRKATKGKAEEALPRLKEFEEILSSGRLRIYYSPDLYCGDLCTLLSFLSSQIKIKAVFLDYVQAIYKEDYRRDRREELREICRELNKTAKDLDLPMVLSAQLNRETPNPTEMSEDNIAESADITRYANTIVCLWNSYFSVVKGGLSAYNTTQEAQRLQDRGFVLGEGGKIYCKITKNRGGTPYLDSVLDFVGETGKIWTNEDLPLDQAPETSPEEEGGFYQA